MLLRLTNHGRLIPKKPPLPRVCSLPRPDVYVLSQFGRRSRNYASQQVEDKSLDTAGNANMKSDEPRETRKNVADEGIQLETAEALTRPASAPENIGSAQQRTLAEHEHGEATDQKSRSLSVDDISSKSEDVNRNLRRGRGQLRNQNLSSLQSAPWPASKATRPLLLTLDAFDTIFTPKEPIAKQYCDVSRNFGLDLDESAVKSAFKTAFKDMNTRFPNYGAFTSVDPETWWTTLINNTLTPLLPPSTPALTLPSGLANTLYDHFSTSAAYTLFPDVLPFLTALGAAGQSASAWPPRRTMLGILSNSDPRVRSILASFEPSIPILPALFPPRATPASRRAPVPVFGPAHPAFAALSYETGMQKPDRRIFDRALRLAQGVLDSMHPVARLTRTGSELLDDVRSEFHCLHVGDEIGKDAVAALGAGWDFVLLDREQEEGVGTRVIEVSVNGDGNENGSGGRREVEITVVNSLLELRYVIRKERLEGKESPWNQTLNPVWLDPVEGHVRRRIPKDRKDLRGRKIIDAGNGDGTSILV